MSSIPEAPAAPALPPESELRGLRALAFPFQVWLGARVMLLFVAWVSMWVDPRYYRPPSMSAPYAALPIFEAWCRWDCPLYYQIANEGYSNGPQTNFFPLLPMLTYAVGFVTRLPLQWALLIVSNAATLAAYVVLYRLFRRLTDEQTARWGLLLYVAYPFSFFHASGFPESLMVLLSALALEAALKGQHFRAGLWLAAGVLSRHVTLLAGAGLLIAQIQQRPSVGKFLKSPAWLALSLPWLSLGGYCLYQYLAWGDFLHFYKARDLWGPMAYWSLFDHLKAPNWSVDPDHKLITAYLPFTAIMVGGVLLTLRKRDWWPITGFGVALSLMLLAVGMWCVGRYSASNWPMFLGLAVVLVKRPTLATLVLCGFAVCQGLFYHLHIHQYPVI